MPLGTAAGVFVLAPSALQVPAPPGVVVVPAADVERVAAEAVRALGAGGCLSVEDALAELECRRNAALEGPVERLRACHTQAAAARVAAAGARPGLSTVPAGLTSALVRSAARHVVEAAETLHVAREAVGTRPGYDDEAARAARAAQADVEQARRDRAAALPRANSALTSANAGAGVLVAARVASEAFDRAFFLVAALPLGALGYTAHAVIAPVHRARAAARRRWAALRSMNVSTMAGLAALEERAGAWERRAARMRAAEAALRQAGDAWRSLVGGAVALASAERLAADLEAAAALDAAACAAWAAWADAAAALQAAEDTAGSGHPPMVVLHPGPATDVAARHLAVQRLATVAGAASVVLVTAGPPVLKLAAPRVVDAGEEPVAEGQLVETEMPLPPPVRLPVRPSPVGAGARAVAAEGSGIVDLRERVKAGLLRLRARTHARRDPSTPDSAAAGG